VSPNEIPFSTSILDIHAPKVNHKIVYDLVWNGAMATEYRWIIAFVLHIMAFNQMLAPSAFEKA
jgi:hypothetical protein